jgi:hypothetical protein
MGSNNARRGIVKKHANGPTKVVTYIRTFLRCRGCEPGIFLFSNYFAIMYSSARPPGPSSTYVHKYTPTLFSDYIKKRTIKIRFSTLEWAKTFQLFDDIVSDVTLQYFPKPFIQSTLHILSAEANW